MKRILPALAVLLLLVTPAVGQDFQKGREAYERGDYATALREFRPLAEQGDAKAQYNLGLMYEEGKFDVHLGYGVPRDYAEALKWYRLSAEQGNALAQRNLGLMYANGGVPLDYVQAHMWLNLAAAQGWGDAAKDRDIIAKRMTPAQIAEAQRMAREWLEKHQK